MATHLEGSLAAIASRRATPWLNLAGTRQATILGTIGTVASLLLVIGGYWDGWWHFNVGRDTFWTRPHLLMYTEVVCGLALGIIGIRDRNLRAAAVVVGLGSLMSITAAPLDNIWHRIFGIDYTIWSLPHVAGIVDGGAVSLIGMLAWWMVQARLAVNNRARTIAHVALATQVGALLPWLLFVLMEYEQTLVVRLTLLPYRWDLQAAYYPVFVAYLSFGLAIAVVRAIGPTILVFGAVFAHWLLLLIAQPLRGEIPFAFPVPLFLALAVLAIVARRVPGLVGDVTACIVAVPMLYLSLALAARPVPHTIAAVAGTVAAAPAAAVAGRLLGSALRVLSAVQ